MYSSSTFAQRPTVDRAHDVVVVGDGPAGSALAHALRSRDADVLLVGRDDPWNATYGVWKDELTGAEVLADAPGGVDEVLLTAITPMRVSALTERLMSRMYAIVDNPVLRDVLRRDVVHLRGTVRRADVVEDRWIVSVDADGDDVTCAAEILVDATGWPRRLGGLAESPDSPVAWQTAFGVVLDAPPDGPMGTATVMDWSAPGGIDNPVPTFGYSLPVKDGWLVEETVLAARHPVEPDLLRPVLARRLGLSLHELDDRALRLERVCIPMGAPLPAQPAPSSDGGEHLRLAVPYGAAAALAHPATGYQIAPAMTLAGHVADAALEALDAPPDTRERSILDAIWSSDRRRTRALHEFGLDVLLRLDADGLRDFFETFFALPDDVWTAQMRIDTPPTQIGAVMLKMFAQAPWRLRRRLLAGDMRLAAGVVSPGSEGVRTWSRRRTLPQPRHR